MIGLKGLMILMIVLGQWFTDANQYHIDSFNNDLKYSWQPRNKNNQAEYRILSEKDNSYLHANSIDSDNFIIKQIEVDLTEYPYLNWRWRVHDLPVNGNESVKEHCDVAASIALVLNKSRIIPKSIKYSWSTSLDKDSFSKSPFAFWPSRCDIHVIESGEEHKGLWRTEKINVLEDYKLFYNKKKVKSKKIHAIVIMTDSDNTNSPSSADYDDIYFSKY